MENRISVWDSPTGSGKTYAMLKYINELPDDTKVIYITPFITETDRVRRDCSKKNFVSPDKKLGSGTKRNHLLQLIREGKNIASTHALFADIDEELINALQSSNYILVLDEVMDVLEKYDLWEENKYWSEEKRDESTRREISALLSKGMIQIDETTGQIEWIDNDYDWFKYERFRNLAKRELLFFIDQQVVVWTFPIDVFRDNVFSEIYILTFQFEYQIQAAYYNYYGVEYKTYHIERNGNQSKVVETVNKDYEEEWIEKVRPLIHILDNYKLNKVGTIDSRQKLDRKSIPLTKTWYENNPVSAEIVGRNIANFFKNYTSASSRERMWTCFVSDKKRLSNNYASSRNWLPINSRATNDYDHKKALAYSINRYLNPFIIHFFSKKNVVLDQDKFALSEMIQWVWRSAARKGEEIDLYIPSHRMRTLLEKYLNHKEIVY